ncbi:MAG: AAA family ATPase [bacterium]|nr:AAA family ATPase [bacterium]
MQLKKLTLTQVRVFEQATFNFQPGMNLIVGINGAGKSTVLDALRIMLSQALPQFTVATKRISLPFEKSDIMLGHDSLTAELDFEAAGITFEHLMHLPREEYVTDKSKDGEVREQTYDLIERNELRTVDFKLIKDGEEDKALLREKNVPNNLWEKLIPIAEQYFTSKGSFLEAAKNQIGFQEADRYKEIILKHVSKERKGIPAHLKNNKRQPLVVYFSTRRSLTNMTALRKSSGQGTAFVKALIHRELSVREFAEWWLTREELAKEDASYLRYISVLQNVITTFLDGCTNLHAVNEPKTTLLIDKGDKTLDVRQLSDGERGVLAIVLDLARRLAQANPKLEDPLKDGKAVVLIDELDLHLHPIWQWTIVDNLTKTFPSCQFIATTHSPEIVGTVAPEQIMLIKDGKTFRPNQSLGMDTNWILRDLMDAGERGPETQQQLKIIETLIEDEEYDEANAAIENLRREIGDFPYLVRLQTRIERILFLGE